MTGRRVAMAAATVGARMFFVMTVVLLVILAPVALLHATGPVGDGPGGGVPNFLVAVGLMVLTWLAWMACWFTARRGPGSNTQADYSDPPSPDRKAAP